MLATDLQKVRQFSVASCKKQHELSQSSALQKAAAESNCINKSAEISSQKQLLHIAFEVSLLLLGNHGFKFCTLFWRLLS
jgi:hypothetical protein